MTAGALVESGADVVVLRHPETVRRIKQIVAALAADHAGDRASR